jgi:hypothetical protein
VPDDGAAGWVDKGCAPAELPETAKAGCMVADLLCGRRTSVLPARIDGTAG